MFRHGNRLYKFERLCSQTAIGRLYERPAGPGEASEASSAALAFPLRAVWRLNTSRREDCPQFLISVPKKRMRQAVSRVLLRRRIREAYRLNRSMLPEGAKVDIAFSYVADTIHPYARIEAAMQRLLGRISRTLAPEAEDVEP